MTQKTAIFRRYDKLATKPFGCAPVQGAYWHLGEPNPFWLYLRSYTEALDWINRFKDPESASQTMLGFREMSTEDKTMFYHKLLAKYCG